MPTGEEIYDQMVFHQVELERVSVYFVREILVQLREMAEELSNAASGATSATIDAVIANIDEIIRNIYLRLTEELRRGAIDVGTAEEQAALWPWILAGVVPTSGAPLVPVIWENRLIEGETIADRWRNEPLATAREARRRIRMAVGEGVRGDRNLRQRFFSWIRRRVEPLVRTTVAAVAQEVRLAMYEANPALVPAVEWAAIIDNRTSQICMGLDGLRWRVDTKAPIGHSRPWRGPPPAHFRCRSSLVGVLANAPPNVNRFDDWLRTQPPGVQREVLGRTRYDLWRAGRITSVKELTDQTNRPLSVADLKNRYGVDE